MNYRSMCVITLVLAGPVACGGGGKTSESAGESTTANQTTSASAGSTGAVTTSATGSGSTTAGTGSASESQGTGEPTTGTPGTSTSGTPGTTGTSTSATGGSSGEQTTGGSTGSTGSTGDTGTSGEMCVQQAGSCAQGQTCCQGLECCAGVPVPMGQEFCGAMCPKSDRNVKRAFRPVDAADILRRVAALEITSWEYKKDPADLRHLGPMAQDFKAAFGLGYDDTTIFPLDASGVAMAAIQGLHAENEALRERVARLEQRLARLER